MRITISKNDTFGQLYIETDNGQSLRIPRHRVTDFRQSAGLLQPCLSLAGQDAERIWAIAQQFSDDRDDEDEEDEEQEWFVPSEYDLW